MSATVVFFVGILMCDAGLCARLDVHVCRPVAAMCKYFKDIRVCEHFP